MSGPPSGFVPTSTMTWADAQTEADNALVAYAALGPETLAPAIQEALRYLEPEDADRLYFDGVTPKDLLNGVKDLDRLRRDILRLPTRVHELDNAISKRDAASFIARVIAAHDKLKMARLQRDLVAVSLSHATAVAAAPAAPARSKKPLEIKRDAPGAPKQWAGQSEKSRSAWSFLQDLCNFLQEKQCVEAPELDREMFRWATALCKYSSDSNHVEREYRTWKSTLPAGASLWAKWDTYLPQWFQNAQTKSSFSETTKLAFIGNPPLMKAVSQSAYHVYASQFLTQYDGLEREKAAPETSLCRELFRKGIPESCRGQYLAECTNDAECAKDRTLREYVEFITSSAKDKLPQQAVKTETVTFAGLTSKQEQQVRAILKEHGGKGSAKPTTKGKAQRAARRKGARVRAAQRKKEDKPADSTPSKKRKHVNLAEADDEKAPFKRSRKPVPDKWWDKMCKICGEFHDFKKCFHNKDFQGNKPAWYKSKTPEELRSLKQERVARYQREQPRK